MRRLFLLLMGLMIVAGSLSAQSGHALFQQALTKERAEGKLLDAIKLYERVAKEFASDRPLAAKALMQIGLCYEKLGKDEARRAYERLVREFADQANIVAQAQARLGVLTQSPSAVPTPARRLVADWRGNYAVPTRDGRQFVRYNERDRAFESTEIGTGTVRQLATDGPHPAQSHVHGIVQMSNAGRRLAACVSATNAPTVIELRIFDVGGRGTGRTVATWDAGKLTRRGVRPFAWSPRDDRIWVLIPYRDQSAEIAWVDLNGKRGTIKRLAYRDHTQHPSLSRDGRFITYHDAPDRQAPPDVYLLAADGSREERLEHPASDDKPLFAPDDSGIVFASDRRGTRDLWFLPIADGRPSGAPRLVWRDIGPYGQAERFADNGSLLFHFAVNDWGTYVVPIDLESADGSIGEPTRLAPMPNETNTAPAFSPDGRYLAHLRGSGRRVVLRDLESGRDREIPIGATLNFYGMIDWCPDGGALIASSYVTGTGFAAYRVNARDGSVRRLPLGDMPTGIPLVCLDDATIVYQRPDRPLPTGSLVRRSLATGEEVVLFQGNADEAVRSPDGRQLAFLIKEEPGARLVTMPISGGKVSRALMTSGYQTSPLRPRQDMIHGVVWTPDSRQLLVARYAEEAAGTPHGVPHPMWLWVVPLDGTAPRRVGRIPLPHVEGFFLSAWSFTLHPDGKRLAFQAHEGLVDQTWAIDNLLALAAARRSARR